MSVQMTRLIQYSGENDKMLLKDGVSSVGAGGRRCSAHLHKYTYPNTAPSEKMVVKKANHKHHWYPAIAARGGEISYTAIDPWSNVDG